MADLEAGAGSDPEFRIVVRHPNERGPLAPYRLALSVLVVVLVFGPTLYSMTLSGTPDDGVLFRAAAVGFLVWVTSGVVNTALATATASSRQHLPVDD